MRMWCTFFWNVPTIFNTPRRNKDFRWRVVRTMHFVLNIMFWRQRKISVTAIGCVIFCVTNDTMFDINADTNRRASSKFDFRTLNAEDQAEKRLKQKRRIKETSPLNSSGAPGPSHRFTQSLIGRFSVHSFTFQSSLPGTPGTPLYRGGKFKLSQSS